MKQKRIILCADDFGMTSGVCRGILTLAQRHRLSAISCMVNGASYASFAPELAALPEQVQIGLHLNLTEGYFLSQKNKACFSLPELLLKTHGRCLSFSLLQNELMAQLDCFTQRMGRWPDFIDGHQHVHQFPMIRRLLLTLYEQIPQHHPFFIRSVWPTVVHPSFQMKARVLAHSGARALHHALAKKAIPHNACFAGIYDFAPHRDYRSLFVYWLQHVPDNTLIMCHPGEGIDVHDVIAQARLNEMAYFSSECFMHDLKTKNIRVANEFSVSP